MPVESVLYHVDSAIAEITLNRPDKLNSLNAAMITQLHAALDKAEADPEVRVILLRGAGRAFCAGFDLGEMEEHPDVETMRQVLSADFDIIMRFWNSPKPTISLTQGYVLGGGFELAMACDVTVADDSAIFGEPEPKFGSGIVVLLLPWLTGPKLAKEMLLFGNDRISAQRAYEAGLVNRVVAPSALYQEGLELARRSALLDSNAVRLTKHAINQSYAEMGIERALHAALEIDVEIETTDTEESRAFMSIMKEQGIKSAIAWRESRFAAPSKSHVNVKEPE